MKRIYYFALTLKYEALTFIGGIILAALTFRYVSDPKTLLVTSIIISTITLFAIIFIRLRERSFIFSSLTWRRDKSPWIGYGEFELFNAQKSFVLTNADPGYIHSGCLTWTDYQFNFDFKIANKCLGVIVRAVNLSNRVMLQITSTGIRPHIWINGGWNVWESKDVKLSFNEELSLDRWYRCRVTCEKDNIIIRLCYKKKTIFDRLWTIPKGSLDFIFKVREEEGKTVKFPFPINLEYGSVGFRNWMDEKAFVKNVLINKL